MAVETITSLQNPRIKRLVRLRERRARDEERAFLVEGYREVLRATEGKAAIDELYYCPAWFLGGSEPALLSAAAQAGARLFELSKEAFAKVAYRDRPDGILDLDPDVEVQNALRLVFDTFERLGEAGAGESLDLSSDCAVHCPRPLRSADGTRSLSHHPRLFPDAARHCL